MTENAVPSTQPSKLKFGFVFPGGDARTAAQYAHEAEDAGWDAFFMWEGLYSVDPWVGLAACAMRTERIRLGTMITPVSRRRPWKLASETVTLDGLSNGRVILGVGLGALETGFANFGEQTDRKIRAELLDEGLEIITKLWEGKPFTYDGKHYHLKENTFAPPPLPVQKPRIPIWVVGAWLREKSMNRVAKYDGLLPNKMTEEPGKFGEVTPDDVRAMKAWIAEHRKLDTPFDIILEGQTPRDQAKFEAYADAGMTWWIEANWTAPSLEDVRERLRKGPPKIG